MNKKNLFVIGVVILVALGVWFYLDSRESVGMQFDDGGQDLAMCIIYNECVAEQRAIRDACKSEAIAGFEECVFNGEDPFECMDQLEAEINICELQFETRVDQECKKKLKPFQYWFDKSCLPYLFRLK